MRGLDLTVRLVDALYLDAMLLADEARGYFDHRGRQERETLDPLTRTTFTCESLKVTTRLMHVIAWLLNRRAVETGEISDIDARDPARRLGGVSPTDPAAVAALPETARGLIAASDGLYRRIVRLDADMDDEGPVPGPARGLIARLEQAFWPNDISRGPDRAGYGSSLTE